MRLPDARLLIFAREPVPGRVKTRLIPALGEQGACDLYCHLLLSTLARFVHRGPCPVELWVTPDAASPFFRDLGSRFGVPVFSQCAGDLGERMSFAAERGLMRGSRVVLIGTDCPALTPVQVAQSLQWLSYRDAVLGPAEDGGYVLLALRRIAAALFLDIPWGSERVARLTRERLAALGWRWSELPLLWDLDRPADLARLPATDACRRVP